MKIIALSALATTFIMLVIYNFYASEKWKKENKGKSTINESSYFKWHIIYVNSNDYRILVPKKTGGGYTVNFGNPASILALVAMGFLFGYCIYLFIN